MGAGDAPRPYAERLRLVRRSARDVENLLNWAKGGFESKKVLDRSQIITEIPVELASDRNYVTVVPEMNVYAFLPVDADLTKLEKKVFLEKETLTAPVKRGEQVGEISVLFDGKLIGTSPLVTKLDAQKSAWLTFKNAVFDKFGIFSVAVILLIVFCVGFALIRFFRFVKKAGR